MASKNNVTDHKYLSITEVGIIREISFLNAPYFTGFIGKGFLQLIQMNLKVDQE